MTDLPLTRRPAPPRRRFPPAGALAALLIAAAPAMAQTTGAPVPSAPLSAAPAPAAQSERESELRGLVDRLQKSEAERVRLNSEIAGLRGDRTRLAAELLKTAEIVRGTETRIADSQSRLDEVATNEAALRRSLDARRDTITEVLAALQRMGRKPPPAVVVQPQDMREAIRAAILLGAVLPEIRGEAERLAADLGELVRLRNAASGERLRLARERDTILAERTRLSALVAARQGQIDTSEKALTEERGRIDGLGRQAQSLRELISRAEAENEASLRALDQARKTPPGGAAQDMAALASAAFKDPARLSPRISLADARGLLPLPVSGTVSKPFGAPDGMGGTERGVTLHSAPDSIVTAPCDSWVLFSGPWRSYGRVLILNAGNGYTFVMTGLHHTSVEIGQFVLAGEPVGVMGPTPDDKSADVANVQLPLYVELRKDNQPVDPKPWWAKTAGDRVTGEKARG